VGEACEGEACVRVCRFAGSTDGGGGGV
jgi:hypothetical protein